MQTAGKLTCQCWKVNTNQMKYSENNYEHHYWPPYIIIISVRMAGLYATRESGLQEECHCIVCPAARKCSILLVNEPDLTNR